MSAISRKWLTRVGFAAGRFVGFGDWNSGTETFSVDNIRFGMGSLPSVPILPPGVRVLLSDRNRYGQYPAQFALFCFLFWVFSRTATARFRKS